MWKPSALRRRLHYHALIPTLMLVASCGGGDSAGTVTPTPTPTPTPTNQAPAFTSGSTVSVEENVTGTIYKAIANDPDGDTLTYSISGGADAARFAITSAGELSFASPPNFDLPSDADRNNIYQVQLSASDGKAATGITVAVTVTNSREGIRSNPAFAVTDPVVFGRGGLVAEKSGRIYELQLQLGLKVDVAQINDLSDVGIVAVTYAGNDFYVMYHNSAKSLVIEGYRRDLSKGTSRRDTILSISAPQYAGGGWLGVDGEGNLVAATGDAGGTGDPTGSAQNDTSMFGKLIRIVPNPDPSSTSYTLTIMAKGLHRPKGGSPFGASGVLIADHGDGIAEEINLFTGFTGNVVNYGWPFKEGTTVVRGTPPAGVIDPVIEYGPSTGRDIIGVAEGIFVIDSLRDKYLFADRNGAIFAADKAAIRQGTTLTPAVIERRDQDFITEEGLLTDLAGVVLITGFRGSNFFMTRTRIYKVDAG